MKLKKFICCKLFCIGITLMLGWNHTVVLAEENPEYVEVMYINIDSGTVSLTKASKNSPTSKQ